MSASEPDIEHVRARVSAMVAEGRLTALHEVAAELHPSDLADLIESLDEEQQLAILSTLSTEVASEALAEMEVEEGAELLVELPPERTAELITELSDDDAVDIIGELDPDAQRRVLEALPTSEAGELRGLLEYDEESAGGLMTTDLVRVEASLTASEAIDQVRIQGQEVEDFYTVFVVDGRDRLLGTLRLDDLVIADPAHSIEELVEDAVSTVTPDVDQEVVGRLIGRYNLAAIPVIDEAGVLLGRITFDDVIDVIEAEQTEDILRFVGVTDDDQLRHGWTESVRVRLPWLMLNLLTAAVAAGVILWYEDIIAEITTLAFIAPIIAAMGGSSGTQSLAITIRRITTEGSGSARGFVLKEILIGMVNGAVLGAGLAALAFFIPDAPPMLGLVVMLAMWGNQIAAGFAGAFIPTMLDRWGVDPSVASSVFVHTLTDLCGFFLLLSLASRMLL